MAKDKSERILEAMPGLVRSSMYSTLKARRISDKDGERVKHTVRSRFWRS